MGIDDKLRSKNGTTIRYFIADHLGSTEALTDANGAITSSTSYDSFGNATSNIPTSYQYTGREYDADTGLYYYRNRWYDPETGRFISEDPIGFAGGDVNLYGYVWNSPYNFTDPFGFQGLGETIADWFDSKIEKARLGAQGDARNWVWNAAMNTLADLASIAPDTLRFGKGIGCALFNDQASGYDKARAVARDVGRGLTVPGAGIAARAAFRAAKGIGKTAARASRSTAKGVAGTNALTKTGSFSKHSLRRLKQRGVTPKMAKTAIRRGRKFYDPKNKTINYVLENKFASGKSLLVGTNPFTGELTTVIRGSRNLVKRRFIEIK